MSQLGMMDFVNDAKSRIKEVDIDAAEAMIAEGCKVLDVREPMEHSGGAIAGALNIPRGILEGAADATNAKGHPDLRDHRDAKWLLVCASGARSAMATDVLQKMGFTDVSNMLGGMMAWTQAEKPLVKQGG